DVGLEVRRKRAGAVGFLHRGDPIAPEDHEDVVELVLMDVAVGAGWEGQLPDAHPVGLEQDLVAHRAQPTRVGHRSPSVDRGPPIPATQKFTRGSISALVGRGAWVRWSRHATN